MMDLNSMIAEYSKRDRMYHRYRVLTVVSRVVSGCGFLLMIGVGGSVDMERYGGQVRDLRYYVLMGLIGFVLMVLGYWVSGLFENEMNANKRWIRRFNNKVLYRGITRIDV